MATFADLGLSDRLLTAIEQKGYKEPSPVQELAIPLVLADKNDLIVQARTGTGKTAAFGLPMMDTIDATGTVKAIILTPTRELAVQITEELHSFNKGKKLAITTVYGGQSISVQEKALRKGCDIIVGTPGRVIDFVKKGKLVISDIKYAVLDEADEMLNMGFIEDVEFILSHTPKEKRMLMFSATMPSRLKAIAEKFMQNVHTVKAVSGELTTDLVTQRAYQVNAKDRQQALDRLICMEKEFYGIIFTQTRIDAEHVSARLNDKGYSVEFLHGDIPQKSRENILQSFKQKRTRILVATDVAARGIDVNDLTHVVNYSVPESPEAYVHRIGRTGRAGESGHSISFACEEYAINLPAIETYIEHGIPQSKYDSDALLDDLPAPIRLQRTPRQGGRRNNQRQGQGQGQSRQRNNRRRPPQNKPA